MECTDCPFQGLQLAMSFSWLPILNQMRVYHMSSHMPLWDILCKGDALQILDALASLNYVPS